MERSNPNQRFILVMRPVPGNWLAPAERRLARVLKSMLRGYGFECVSAREVSANPDLTPQPSPGTQPQPFDKN